MGIALDGRPGDCCFAVNCLRSRQLLRSNIQARLNLIENTPVCSAHLIFHFTFSLVEGSERQLSYSLAVTHVTPATEAPYAVEFAASLWQP